MQVGNTHATRRAILFKNLNYTLREFYDILSEDALNYPVTLALQSLAIISLSEIDIFFSISLILLENFFFFFSGFVILGG